MSYKSPPLSILPVFEAAARHLNFRKAAQELHVTPSAISQQVKNLESMLDEELFDRSAKLLSLTEAGEKFYLLSTKILQQYHDDLTQFQAETKTLPLRLTTTPFIASEILIPGIHQFNQADLRIETSEEVIDIVAEDYTAAVRIGHGNWPGCRCREIMPMSIALTCSPELLETLPYREISDLLQYPLIHSSIIANHWQLVSNELGINLLENKQLFFDNYITAVAAAEQGLGLLSTLLPITNKRIKQGSLVTIYDGQQAPGLSYYLVEKNFSNHSKYAMISDQLFAWVKEQFANGV